MDTAPLHRLALGLMMLLTLLSPADEKHTDVPSPAEPPAVTMQGGSPEEEELLAWAISRYEQAGLGLPPIVVRFHADSAVCGELDGFIGSVPLHYDDHPWVEFESARVLSRRQSWRHNLLAHPP